MVLQPGIKDVSPFLSVLVLSPTPQVHGGVSAFVETMKAHLQHCRVTSLWVGSVPHRREHFFVCICRIVCIPFKVWKIVKREPFDVVHLNPSLDAKSLLRDGLILLALRLAGCRHVMVYFHGWQWALARQIQSSFLLRGAFRWMLNGSARIMVLSPDFKKILETMGVDPDKVLYTRTMFDGSAFRSLQEKPMDSARRNILFMSRFVRAKGVYELLEAFARIADIFPDVDLVMAGDGPESDGLRRVAHALGERVRFMGYVTGDAKYHLLNACSVFALPTWFPEGMPVALLEAMGAGKPLLTAKAGVIEHIIAEPENGVVLSHVTTDTVEAALRKMLDDPLYCEETGKRNAAYAWRYFKAATVTAEIEAVYREIAVMS